MAGGWSAVGYSHRRVEQLVEDRTTRQSSASRVPTVVLISSFCKTHGRQTQMSGARKADALQALAPAERAPLASWHEPAMTIPRRSHATPLEDRDRPVQRPSEPFIILGYLILHTEKGESRARVRN